MNKKNIDKIVINWYPGHMAKTKREIKEKQELIFYIIYKKAVNLSKTDQKSIKSGIVFWTWLLKSNFWKRWKNECYFAS